MPDNAGPLSWRDVYRAVAESEVRIVAAINTAVAPLTASSADHEGRIRSLELGGSNEAKEANKAIAALTLRVAALELEENTLMAREKGILATLSAGQKTVLLLASIVGMALAFSHLLEGFVV